MTTAHRLTRIVSLFLLGLQALLWIGGPIADGILDASSARTVAHVEELGGTKCPRVHSHVDCLICRTLSLTGIPVAAAAERPDEADECAGARQAAWRPVLDGTRGMLGSRAPPAGRATARHA